MEQPPKSKILYKDPEIRAAIADVASEVFESKEISKKTIGEMFGLPADVELSSEEKEEFRLFVEYASKRIINAAVHQFEQDPIPKEDALAALNGFKEHMGDIAFHDISHAIVNYDDKHEGNSVVPAFFTEEVRVNNPVIIAEEPRALMRETIFGDYPIFISLMNPEKKKKLFTSYEKKFSKYDERYSARSKEIIADAIDQCDSKSFESVFNTYLTVVYRILRDVNQKTFEIQQEHMPEESESMNEEFDAIAREQMANPDPRLVSMARSVYENYATDQKILFNEFKKICGPLIEKLKRQK